MIRRASPPAIKLHINEGDSVRNKDQLELVVAPQYYSMVVLVNVYVLE